ncbi:MAG: HAMP domain-containing sensor histidine kinase [Arcobacteraceae bacterium]|nr:HAMP domain-containing sensor histidine kinase [Arcobacteraceae bacterium]
MGIVLTKDEKRTFYGFYSFFLTVTFILLLIISWLFFETKSSFFRDITISNMQLNASKLASKIIYAHMQNIPLKRSDLVVDKGFNFGLYDHNGVVIISTIAKPITLNKKFSQIDNNLILIDRSVSGHLGVSYVAIEEVILFEALKDLKHKIIILFILFYLLIIIFGFYLTKLFIQPIVQQRLKLNNFIKDTTHELNTPITALMMSANPYNTLDEKGLHRIQLSAKRISDIYSDLTYLFLNNEQEKAQRIPMIELKDILNEQLEYYHFFAQKKRVILTYDIHSCFYAIDKESFNRIVNNLISNAIKYTKPQGTVFVQLKDNVLLVQDNGVGIPKKSLSKIFERFYRESDIVGGFGIGLHIVASICKKYHIKIEIDSKVNEGTTFKLKF